MACPKLLQKISHVHIKHLCHTLHATAMQPQQQVLKATQPSETCWTLSTKARASEPNATMVFRSAIHVEAGKLVKLALYSFCACENASAEEKSRQCPVSVYDLPLTTKCRTAW